MAKLLIYNIDVEDSKLKFSCVCTNDIIRIDRIAIESKHEMCFGWCEIWIINHLIYAGPYKWFSQGGLDLVLSPYVDVNFHIRTFDEYDKWFHGSNCKLRAYDKDGIEIKIEYRGQFDRYIK